jgi:hypothetical protein
MYAIALAATMLGFLSSETNLNEYSKAASISSTGAELNDKSEKAADESRVW